MPEKRLKKRREKGFKQRQKAMDTLNLAEVISFLQGYLDDKYILPPPIKQVPITKKHAPKTKKQRQAIKPPTASLPEAIALISERVITKYCNGLQPHFERMRIWDICLRLLEELAQEGIISPGSEESYVRKGYLFRCLLYHSEEIGKIIIPIEPPQIYNGQQNIPALTFNNAISRDKSMARKIILKQAAYRQIIPQKWHFVYILQCGDQTLYTGCCQDILYIVAMHRRRKICPYTKSRLPVRLVYWEPFLTQQEALARQQQIRGYSRARKLKLIANAVNLSCRPAMSQDY